MDSDLLIISIGTDSSSLAFVSIEFLAFSWSIAYILLITLSTNILLEFILFWFFM